MYKEQIKFNKYLHGTLSYVNRLYPESPLNGFCSQLLLFGPPPYAELISTVAISKHKSIFIPQTFLNLKIFGVLLSNSIMPLK